MDRTKRVTAEVISVRELGSGLGRVDLCGEGIGRGVRMGHFVMAEAPGRMDCVLLRPYSYFVAPSEDRIGLLIRSVGKGTEALLGARPGTRVALLGPLGNAFPSPSGDVWMIAGGVGAAPFGVDAGADGTEVLFGARTAAELGFAHALEEVGARVEIATDDGSAGFSGSVVDLLRERLRGAKPDAIYTCGPTPMMKAVAGVARSHEVPCWVSLEERMGCGIGICRGCAHRDSTGGWRCICEDGPVYPATEIFGAEEVSGG